MKISTPTTNLLAHQALVSWYQEIMKIEKAGTPICVLMLRIPGEYISAKTPCDIVEKRTVYLKTRRRCFHGKHCMPRLREARSEPTYVAAQPILYGKNYSEHDETCVICKSGKWYRCYLEYGDNTAIKSIIKSNYVIVGSYNDLVIRTKEKAP